MKRTTGTHVYTLLKCRRAVALDLVGDRDLKRRLRDEEEFVLKRGRDLEARIVAELGWAEPEFEARDWEAGARATQAMLHGGVEGVSQGILLGDGRLGIPDLLRREPGASVLGDFHYVVGDVKSSIAPRSDQILQVVFYSEMLAELQQRDPEYGYLVLRDGHEERFRIADYAPAMRQVMREIAEIRSEPDAVRPFFSMACGHCPWSEVCEPELAGANDLSLLSGVTRSLRAVLESVGIEDCTALAEAPVDRIAERTRLEPALLRRLQRQAEARVRREPIFEPRSSARQVDGVIVHLMTDPFADRLLWVGAMHGDTVEAFVPASRDEELDGFLRLVERLPKAAHLLHFGAALPRWFESRSYDDPGSLRVEQRFVDLARRLRAASTLPGVAFGLADFVRLVLDRDPHRFGRADEAALRAERGEREWLAEKGRGDLVDLVDLKAALLDSAEVSR